MTTTCPFIDNTKSVVTLPIEILTEILKHYILTPRNIYVVGRITCRAATIVEKLTLPCDIREDKTREVLSIRAAKQETAAFTTCKTFYQILQRFVHDSEYSNLSAYLIHSNPQHVVLIDNIHRLVKHQRNPSSLNGISFDRKYGSPINVAFETACLKYSIDRHEIDLPDLLTSILGAFADLKKLTVIADIPHSSQVRRECILVEKSKVEMTVPPEKLLSMLTSGEYTRLYYERDLPLRVARRLAGGFRSSFGSSVEIVIAKWNDSAW